MNDITINKLLARGANVRDSELRFYKGVNLITGGSDTGKSYAFDLIDFLFGSTNEPNYIEERKGYSDFFLEINVNGEIYTLSRSLDNIKSIYVCFCSIAEINERTTFDEYKVASTAKKSISMFLLNRLGIKEKLYFIRNKKNDLQQLTFRSYIKSFMISEEKITAKSISIVETELKHPKETFTREKFYYFLTKNGNKRKKVVKRKPQNSKNKLDILLEIKAEYELNLQQLEKEFTFAKDEGKVETNILEFKNSIQKLEAQIKEMVSKRDGIIEDVNKVDLKIASNDLTINRFEVLLKQYLVEMDRIDFMYKSENYLSQIKKATCPVCKTEIKNNHERAEDIFLAYNAERSKISLKANDIKESINDIKERNNNLMIDKEDKLIEIASIDNELNEKWNPMLEELINEYEELLEVNKNQTKHNLYSEEIKKIQKKIDVLDLINNDDDENDADENVSLDTTLLINRRDELCREMKNLLEKFKFSNKVNVTYDESDIDFIVNEQNRKAYGQGYSSIIYVSFVLALKKVMDKYSVETPNFIIFDSPFTSLTEGDELKDERIRVSSKIFNAFFTYCCKEYENKQLIIFENTDEKYDYIDKRVNYIHFTKNHNIGRYGFFIGK